ncbi:WhiB family transcriptional regulator [Streptomyces sp. NPDC002812]|uniref:WhiB family transcriptional regulator n=1 Tax=Streptomyces sp. NPDC002812 TaxID=3154434 RepID=UPI0033218049
MNLTQASSPYRAPAAPDPAPNWRTFAACTQPGSDPELWYSTAEPAIEEARAYCRSCPVLADCLRDAMVLEGKSSKDNRYGVRGTYTPGERAALYRKSATVRAYVASG